MSGYRATAYAQSIYKETKILDIKTRNARWKISVFKGYCMNTNPNERDIWVVHGYDGEIIFLTLS
jgi:hypothetical protein